MFKKKYEYVKDIPTLNRAMAKSIFCGFVLIKIPKLNAKNIFMKQLFILLGFTTMLITSCSMYSPVKKDNNTLPIKMLNIISKSDSVDICQLDAMNSPNDTDKTICGYAVVSNLKILNDQDVKKLQEIVDSLSSLGENKIKKLSTFIPDYAFRFYNRGGAVFLLLDQHADLCNFYYHKKQFLMDTDSVKNALKELLDDIFENNNQKTETRTSKNLIDTLHPKKEDVFLNSSNQKIDSVSMINKESQYVILNNNIIEILKSAESMYCCIIDPLSKEDNNLELLDKYVILQKKEITSENQKKSIIDLITDKMSFEKFDWVKNCTFLPDIALQATSNGRELNILFSFYCNECMMILDGKQVFRNDCSLIQPRIIRMARQIFPNDKYLRTIVK